MSKHFLAIVRNDHPKLYRCLIALLLLIGGVTIVRIEAPPFYVWSMYAQPIPAKDTYDVYVLTYDGEVFNEPAAWDHHRRIAFNYSIDFYDQCLQAGMKAADGIKLENFLAKITVKSRSYIDQVYINNKDIEQYPYWLKSYMSELIGKPIHTMTVYKYTIQYAEDGHPIILNKVIVCSA